MYALKCVLPSDRFVHISNHRVCAADNQEESGSDGAVFEYVDEHAQVLQLDAVALGNR
jgi:hypothetical protein